MGFKSIKEGKLIRVKDIIYKILSITTTTDITGVVSTYSVSLERHQNWDHEGEPVNEDRWPKRLDILYTRFGSELDVVEQAKIALKGYAYKRITPETDFTVTMFELMPHTWGCDKKEDLYTKGVCRPCTKKSVLLDKVNPYENTSVQVIKNNSNIDKSKYPCWWLIAGG